MFLKIRTANVCFGPKWPWPVRCCLLLLDLDQGDAYTRAESPLRSRALRATDCMSSCDH